MPSAQGRAVRAVAIEPVAREPGPLPLRARLAALGFGAPGAGGT